MVTVRLRDAAEAVLISPARHILLLLLDAAIATGSLYLALFLRFDAQVPASIAAAAPDLALLLIASRSLTSLALRVHRWSFRLSGLADGVRLAAAAVAGTLLFLVLVLVVGPSAPPRSVVVLELLISLLAMAVVRFSPRYAVTRLTDWTRSQRDGAVRTVIVGAGATGETLLRDLQRSDEHDYIVVGFVDDDRSKWGLVVGGKPVLGGIDDLPELIRQNDVGMLLLAIPRASGARVRAVLSLCGSLGVSFKILPVSYVYLQERVTASMLQDLQPEDLLPREQVNFSDTGGLVEIARRTVLVTGAAGSIGSEICSQLLAAGVGTLVMVDLNENDMYLAARRNETLYPGCAIHAEVADVRDSSRLRDLFERHRPDDVFHAAAHKHVPLMEAAPGEAVKNNVLGTKNVALAAHESGVARFVYVSTDKAVRPTSVMGASKRVGEEIVRAMARRSSTRFTVVRFGNVLGSAGSVIPIFREQIARGGPITVTHPDVRRYFMTISEAVNLVLRAGYGDYGELCILEMGEQIRIVELARHLIAMSGLVPDVDIKIVFSGLRPGEKLYEELLTDEEERVRSASRKILVATSPPPPHDLDDLVGELAHAAYSEDGDAVRRLLARCIPSYSPGQFGPPRLLDRSNRPAINM